MLSQTYPPEKLKNILLPRENWRPYPGAGEREPWEALPAGVRRGHLARGEKALGFDWPQLPASLFLEYARTGNRSRYERESFRRRSALSDLVIAECVEAKGRFLDDIVNGVWAICEETYWGIPAHVGVQKAGAGLPDVAEPTVDLFAAETAALLAWTYYLLGASLDAVSPLVRPRILREMDRRMFTPCLERDDFWWMGFAGRRVNNWNPWVNSNWLACALLVEQDAERRLATVSKILRSLDRFIDPYPKDGGCDEGPGYWGRAGASLFDNLELLHSATGGAIDVYDDPLIRDIGRFIYRVQICGHYFVNFADASAVVNPSAALVYRYGKRIGDEYMVALGAWLAQQEQVAEKGFADSIGRRLPALFSAGELLAAAARQPLPRDVWLPDIQVVAARDREGSCEGFYLAAKGGHNAESHNHNDIGNAVVYIDGKPLLVDAGVGEYTAKTFSSHRYEIWTMQSAYHTLPTVNGVQQAPGREFAAKDVAHSAHGRTARFELDIAPAYPPGAKLNAWVRTLTLTRGQDVVIQDAYDLQEISGELSLSLITPCHVTLEDAGCIALGEAALPGGRVTAAGRVLYDADRLSATKEEVSIEDARMRTVWGERLTRVVLTARNPELRDAWTLRVSR